MRSESRRVAAASACPGPARPACAVGQRVQHIARRCRTSRPRHSPAAREAPPRGRKSRSYRPFGPPGSFRALKLVLSYSAEVKTEPLNNPTGH
eukprot:scaffold22810_cov127-Isochrysis_galbana.AAC.5